MSIWWRWAYLVHRDKKVSDRWGHLGRCPLNTLCQMFFLACQLFAVRGGGAPWRSSAKERLFWAPNSIAPRSTLSSSPGLHILAPSCPPKRSQWIGRYRWSFPQQNIWEQLQFRQYQICSISNIYKKKFLLLKVWKVETVTSCVPPFVREPIWSYLQDTWRNS